MAGLSSWLSSQVTHALGWALIHSLWQCLGIAALAAAVMACSRRPSVRYLVGIGALTLMLAAPIATFLVLVKPEVPVQASLGSTPTAPIPAPATMGAPLVAAISGAGSRAVAAIAESPRHILVPDVLPWLVGAWLCGVALLSLRLAGGFLLLEHRRRSHTSALSPAILAMCLDVQRQLGLERAIRYLQCGWVQAPAVIGWLRPVVLLPVTAITGLSEPELRAVIAHEMAHVRRFDAFANLFQILVETLLFYHPAVWWLNKRIRADRELCCDDIAVALTGNRFEYARALTRMAEWKDVPFLAMAANRGPLSARIFHILGTKSSTAGQRMLGLTGSVVFLAAALGAANALFGIAYPIPAAHAKASVKAVLVSSQTAVSEIARQALQAREGNQQSRSGKNSRELGSPSQTGDPSEGQAKMRVGPPTDLPPHVHEQAIETPSIVASIRTPAASPEGDRTMRKTLMAASSLALLAGASQVGAQSDEALTGVHDPDALTCDAPQLVPLVRAVRWRMCIQNSLVATLDANGGLSLGGTVVRSYSDLPISEQPTGAGDPNAVTCQEAQPLSGSRLQGPIACAHNAFWAKLAAGGCVLTPNARFIIYSTTSKKWDTGACRHMKGRNGWLPPRFF